MHRLHLLQSSLGFLQQANTLQSQGHLVGDLAQDGHMSLKVGIRHRAAQHEGAHRLPAYLQRQYQSGRHTLGHQVLVFHKRLPLAQVPVQPVVAMSDDPPKTGAFQRQADTLLGQEAVLGLDSNGEQAAVRITEGVERQSEKVGRNQLTHVLCETRQVCCQVLTGVNGGHDLAQNLLVVSTALDL